MEAHVRPLRADAARNRTRVLDAARTAFAEAGLDVGVEEIARRAGVGKGTLYRRFPTKEALVRAIFEDILDEVEQLAAEARRGAGRRRGVRPVPQRGPRACRPPTRASTTSSRSGWAPPPSPTSSAESFVGGRRAPARARPAGRRRARRPRARGRPDDAPDARRRRPGPRRTGTRWTTTGRAISGCCWTPSGRARRRRSRPSRGGLQRVTLKRRTSASSSSAVRARSAALAAIS